MIKVEITDNGYITIDVSSADANRLGRFPYAAGTDIFALRLAEVVGGDPITLRRMSLRKKNGVSNMGWTATFIDADRQAEYVARHAQSEGDI
jgi:hypothetical protein